MNHLTWAGNLSFSSFNNFERCERKHFYGAVLKLKPTDSVEQKWGKFGNVVHKCIETGKPVNPLWEKYKLYDTDMSIDSAKQQIAFARKLGYKFKHQELLILFQIGKLKFKMFIDGVMEDYSVVDWKTSTFTNKNLKDYREQVLWYSWGIWKKYGIIPPKAIIVYTKEQKALEGKSRVFEFNFTEKDLIDYEKHIFEVVAYQNTKKTTEDFKTNNKSCFFCQYKSKCYKDAITDEKFLNVNITYNHDIVKIDTPMPKEFNNLVECKLSYEMDNAHFVIKHLKSRGVTNFDGIIQLYKNQTTSLGLKREIIFYLEQYAEHKGLTLLLHETDNRVLPRNLIEVPDKLEGVELRLYQKDAIWKIIKDQISFTELCTSSGKTIMAAEIIRKLGFKTLFVVDRNILLQQTYDVFKKLGLKNLGTVTGGKQDWNDITIASIQTLCNIKNIEGIKHITDCNVVIVDEAHSSKSKSYQKLMKMIGAEYRIGLTGTAYSDGNDSLELYKSFGVPHYKIRAIDLINAGYLTMPEITFIDYKQEFTINGDYIEVYEQLLKSKPRLDVLDDIMDKHFNDNVLIMVDRLEHVNIIKEMFPWIQIITGDTKKKEREEILKGIRATASNILVATSGVIQKGVDIPTLDVLVNYCANLGSIKTVQFLGRGLRKSKSKMKVYYYDFNDTHRALISHTKGRKQALLNQGYDITNRKL